MEATNDRIEKDHWSIPSSIARLGQSLVDDEVSSDAL